MTEYFRSRGSIPTVNIISYSYKGGSGRSTASVNLAFELARQGKKVVCIDMDVGAPGLHMIMKEWTPEAREAIDKNNENIGHQRFLNAMDPGPRDFEAIRPAMLNIRKLTGKEEAQSNPWLQKLDSIEDAGGELLFLFSSTTDRTLKDLGGDVEKARIFFDKFSLLIQFLGREIGGTPDEEVYILVDAPNGITQVSLPLLRFSDLILMFYRYSIQHVLGTVESGEKLYYYLRDELNSRYMKIFLVGSCVPEDMVMALRRNWESGELEEGSFEWDMADRFTKIESRLEEFSNYFINSIILADDYIIEDDILKVLEQPLTNEGVDRYLLGYTSDDDRKSSEKTLDKITRIVADVSLYGKEVARRKKAIYRASQ